MFCLGVFFLLLLSPIQTSSLRFSISRDKFSLPETCVFVVFTFIKSGALLEYWLQFETTKKQSLKNKRMYKHEKKPTIRLMNNNLGG